MHRGYSVPGVVTGKPIAIGGSVGRADATGQGVVYTIADAARRLGFELGGRDASRSRASATSARRLPGCSTRPAPASSRSPTSDGGVRDPDGPRRPVPRAGTSASTARSPARPGTRPIDQRRAVRARRRRPRPGRSRGPDHGGERRHRAGPDPGRGGQRPRRARTPTRSSGATASSCIPDILCNAGGVIVSYFEWAQNRAAFAWTLDEINERLERPDPRRRGGRLGRGPRPTASTRGSRPTRSRSSGSPRRRGSAGSTPSHCGALRRAPPSAHSTSCRSTNTAANATSARRPEPAPAVVTGTTGRFVIQRHRATRLHYDFRLEIEGVLVSWAVPKGLTLDSSVRRMAVHVEDHPIEYFDFEGVIPSKQYGAGDVIVWDWGTWEPEAPTLDPRRAIEDGELKFILHGQKVNGRFTIVRTSGRKRKGDDPSARAFEDDQGQQWLLIKKRDEAYVAGWDAEDHPQSVKTGRTNDDVKADRDALWNGQAPAAAAEIDLTGAVEAQMPPYIEPMLATLASKPFSDPDWLYEIKWDGFRVQAVDRWREGQDLDPRPQGRRDLFPAAPVAGLLDRRQAGHRRWRGRGHRRGRAPGLLAAPDEARQAGSRRPHLPAVRPALSRRPARCSTSRSRIASGCSRACSRATRASASRRMSSARARRSSRRRGPISSRASSPSCGGAGTSRAGAPRPG